MTTKLLEIDAIKLLAENYQKNGYEVQIEPNKDKIPFDLFGYRPDMIAIKDDKKLIIELKAKKSSIEHLQKIAHLVSEQQGWRFIVITLDDVENGYLPTIEEECLTWIELEKKVAQVPLLMDAMGNDAALIYIWGLVEAVLRRYSIDSHLAIERLAFTTMVKHLYSIGELSIEELNFLLTIQTIRNKVAHGCHVEMTREILNQLVAFINKAISDWRI